MKLYQRIKNIKEPIKRGLAYIIFSCAACSCASTVESNTLDIRLRNQLKEDGKVIVEYENTKKEITEVGLYLNKLKEYEASLRPKYESIMETHGKIKHEVIKLEKRDKEQKNEN